MKFSDRTLLSVRGPPDLQGESRNHSCCSDSCFVDPHWTSSVDQSDGINGQRRYPEIEDSAQGRPFAHRKSRRTCRRTCLDRLRLSPNRGQVETAACLANSLLGAGVLFRVSLKTTMSSLTDPRAIAMFSPSGDTVKSKMYCIVKLVTGRGGHHQ